MDALITRRSPPASVVSPVLTPWVRNPNWLTLPTVLATEQKFVGLHAIWPDSNFLAVSAAGAFTVNWGDGTVQNFAAGVVAQKQYDFNSPAFVGTDAGGALPYRQAVVTITPQSGQTLTILSLNHRHTAMGVTIYCSGWLDMVISGPSLTNLSISSSSQNVNHLMLEQASLLSNNSASFFGVLTACRALRSIPTWFIRPSGAVNLNSMFKYCSSLQTAPMMNTQAVNNMSNMFSGCTSLQVVPLLNLQAVTSTEQMFFDCISLTNVPLLNTQSCTTMAGMFQNCMSLQTVPLLNMQSAINLSSMFANCSSLQTVPLFNTATVTNMTSMFSSCISLLSVPLFNTAAVNNMTSMFYGCISLQAVPLFNTVAVTVMTSMFLGCISLQTVPLFNTAAVVNMNSMFQSCSSLQLVPAFNMQAVPDGGMTNIFAACPSLLRIAMVGVRISFSVAGCKLSAAGLNEIYTNLATIAGRTITVTSNWGTTGDNPAIATAKGWTVVGS